MSISDTPMPESQRRRGKNVNISMSYEQWELFKAAVARKIGHSCTEAVCMEQWRDLDRLARKQFMEFWRE